MQILFVFVLAMLIAALPVRLAAHWFKAEHATWGRSIALLFVSGLVVGIALQILPPFARTGVGRFAVTFFIVAVCAQILLGIRFLQAAVLAVFLAAFYSFGGGVSPTGQISTRF